jgi:pantoate kinase
MSKTAVAFCPGHISGYFRPIIGDDEETCGSIGAGIVIDEGVTVYASPAPVTGVTIYRYGQENEVVEKIAGSPPVEYLIRMLDVKASVRTVCHLPIGAGFGLSAAALLGSAIALNALFSIGLSPEECTALAHDSEIVHRTGLGDVAACQGGGYDCRCGPGIRAGIIRRFDLADTIAVVTGSPLPTPAILSSPEIMESVHRAFPDGCPENPRDLFRKSRIFAERTGLITPPVREMLAACDASEIPSSMTMLGNGVFALGEQAISVLSPFGEVYRLHVASEGFRLCGVEQ